MTTRQRLARLEKDVIAKTRSDAVLYWPQKGTYAIPVCTGNEAGDGFLWNVGCTRPYLNAVWAEATLQAILDALCGEWQKIDTVFDSLETASVDVTWQELNVVLLPWLETGQSLERRAVPHPYYGHERQVRLVDRTA